MVNAPRGTPATAGVVAAGGIGGSSPTVPPPAGRPQQLMTVERRLYDICAVLCTVGLVKKMNIGKRQPGYVWSYDPASRTARGPPVDEGVAALAGYDGGGGGGANLIPNTTQTVVVPPPSQGIKRTDQTPDQPHLGPSLGGLPPRPDHHDGQDHLTLGSNPEPSDLDPCPSALLPKVTSQEQYYQQVLGILVTLLQELGEHGMSVLSYLGESSPEMVSALLSHSAAMSTGGITISEPPSAARLPLFPPRGSVPLGCTPLSPGSRSHLYPMGDNSGAAGVTQRSGKLATVVPHLGQGGVTSMEVDPPKTLTNVQDGRQTAAPVVLSSSDVMVVDGGAGGTGGTGEGGRGGRGAGGEGRGGGATVIPLLAPGTSTEVLMQLLPLLGMLDSDSPQNVDAETYNSLTTDQKTQLALLQQLLALGSSSGLPPPAAHEEAQALLESLPLLLDTLQALGGLQSPDK